MGYVRQQSDFDPQAIRSRRATADSRRRPGRDLQAMDVPFLVSAALRSGELTRNDLRTRFRPIFRDVYVGRDAEITAAVKARGAWLSTGATLCGCVGGRRARHEMARPAGLPPSCPCRPATRRKA